jgi:hypothetical protein
VLVLFFLSPATRPATCQDRPDIRSESPGLPPLPSSPRTSSNLPRHTLSSCRLLPSPCCPGCFWGTRLPISRPPLRPLPSSSSTTHALPRLIDWAVCSIARAAAFLGPCRRHITYITLHACAAGLAWSPLLMRLDPCRFSTPDRAPATHPNIDIPFKALCRAPLITSPGHVIVLPGRPHPRHLSLSLSLSSPADDI